MTKEQVLQLRIKSRLTDLNKTQVELMDELEKRGIKVCPSILSNAIKGRIIYDNATKIVSKAHEIVSEWEMQAQYRRI